jgi:hypothetical protein
MHSIVVVQQTASVYDLTTVAAANAFLGLTSSVENDANIAAHITSASQIIANQCDRVFAMQDVVETFFMRSGEYGEVLNLDRPPVIAISSIVQNGQSLTPDFYDADLDKGFIWRRCDFLPWTSAPYPYGYGNNRIAVTYTGGYDLPTGAPADLALACLLLMKEQRFMQARGDPSIRSLSHGDVTIFYQQTAAGIGAGQGALPPAVDRLLAPYKFPAAA